jgi:predicted RNase H-like nuclease (RuvC/YqgF family)
MSDAHTDPNDAPVADAASSSDQTPQSSHAQPAPDHGAIEETVDPSDASDLSQPTDGEAEETEKLVPVTEAIRYRKRAQQAERQVGDMQTRMQSLQSQLDEAQQTIDHLERRQKIDALLAESEPIDTEAVRLLTEQAVQQMDEPDVQAAVEELRQSRPYLFRQQRGSAGSAMAARVTDPAGGESEDAAEQAAISGDRRDLLRYLRLRRGR